MFVATSIFRSTSQLLYKNPSVQQLFFSNNSISSSSSSKQTIINPNPPLVGQAIEVKEFLRENSIPFDESWTCIKALCCRSSNRLSGLIHIGKQRGSSCDISSKFSSMLYLVGDFACSKCSTTGTWKDFKSQWEHIRSRFDG